MPKNLPFIAEPTAHLLGKTLFYNCRKHIFLSDCGCLYSRYIDHNINAEQVYWHPLNISNAQAHWSVIPVHSLYRARTIPHSLKTIMNATSLRHRHIRINYSGIFPECQLFSTSASSSSKREILHSAWLTSPNP